MHDMPFVDPPDRKSLELAERFLLEIGALDRKDNNRFILTDLGRRISKMPCHPRLAAAISQAKKITITGIQEIATTKTNNEMQLIWLDLLQQHFAWTMNRLPKRWVEAETTTTQI